MPRPLSKPDRLARPAAIVSFSSLSELIKSAPRDKASERTDHLIAGESPVFSLLQLLVRGRIHMRDLVQKWSLGPGPGSGRQEAFAEVNRER